MKKIILFLLTNISLISFSQNFSFPKTLVLFEIDQFENIFILNENNKILKYPKSNYANYLEFQKIEYGHVQKILVNNPFRLILFYKDNQKILFLDKNLKELNLHIDLNHLFNESIIDVANASNLLFFISEMNNIFIYDLSRGKIINTKKINPSTSSKNFRNNEYTQIFSNNNQIALLTSSSMSIFNHQLKLLFHEKKEWANTENTILFDHNNFYEYTYKKNQLFLIETNNQFNKKLLQTNIKTSFFKIKNEKIFTLENGSLKQQLLK
jgi:hypothetical protein